MRICSFIGDMYRDYPSAIIKTLKKIATERGHIIDIFGNCAVPNENPLHNEGLKSILSIPPLSDYDGIILCSDTLNHAGISRDMLENLKSAEDIPPVVSIRSEEEGFYNIIPDNKRILYEITKYVIGECKSSDIGFVMGRDDLVDSHERRAGFEQAMEEAGYKVSEDMVFHGNYWVDQGPETADFFIREDKSLPRAIICSNDYMAIALIDELLLRGYRIPEDTMITGVDNQPGTNNRIPSLTTFEISAEYLSTHAMDSLEKIVGGCEIDHNILVSGKLLVRESTGGVTERNVNEAYLKIDTMQKEYYHKTFSFVMLSADYEDALSYKDCVHLTLESIRSNYQMFDRCFIISYLENNRALEGYYDDEGIHVNKILFSENELMPVQYIDSRIGIRIFLPIFYKNEVYGYAVLECCSGSTEEFFDEKLEFTLMLMGQTINRLRLYSKLFEFEDVMEMYIRDTLTGLYNRRGFENRVSDIFRNTDLAETGIAVASIDMDGLKAINDTYGHSAGDDAIKTIAMAINASLNEDEFAARMGGDEFEAVLKIDTRERIGTFIRTLRSQIESANKRKKTAYELSASLGICIVPEWSALMDSMNKADKAMYIEKNLKKRSAQR